MLDKIAYKPSKKEKMHTICIDSCATGITTTNYGLSIPAISLGDCMKPASACFNNPVQAPTCPPIQEKQKGTTMYLNGTYDLEAQKRNYFAEQVSAVYSSKFQDLRKQFGLVDDDAPRSPKEFDERIKAGKYTWNTKDLDKKVPYYALTESYLVWRDPAVLKDEEGFTAAEAKLSAARLKTTGAIVVGALTDLPRVLEDFESATFH